jgi:hypothetical protein
MRKNIIHMITVCTLIFALFSPLFTSLSRAQTDSNPAAVNIPGTHQDELGCSGEWQPDCEDTMLLYDEEDDVWQGTFEIEPGNDDDEQGPRYKAALNGGWSENYGQNAAPGGADIPLVVDEATEVKFY